MIFALALLVAYANAADCTYSVTTGYLWSTMSDGDVIAQCTDATDGCNTPTVTGLACDTANHYVQVSTPTVTQCASGGGPATLTGCELQCKTPATQNGYTGFTASTDVTNCLSGSGNCATPTIPGSAACDTGFTFANGVTAVTIDPSTGVCSSLNGQDVTFSGCVRECKTPDALPTGYAGFTLDAAVTSCTSEANSCDSATLTPAVSGTPADCDTANGYVGTMDVGECSMTNDDVVLTGCAAQDCKFPATIGAGYTLSNANGAAADALVSTADGVTTCNSIAGGCTVVTSTDLTCATGYAGTPGWTACDGSTEYVTLTGCNQKCKTPLTADLPAGYTGIDADAFVDDTCTTAACPDTIAIPTSSSVACAAGYSNGGDNANIKLSGNACTTSDLTVDFVGCDYQCQTPATQTGYTGFTASTDITGCVVGACDTANVALPGAAACDSDYEAGTSGLGYTVCTAGNPVTMTGCEMKCKTPATADMPAGYTGIDADTLVTNCNSEVCTGSAPSAGGNAACDTANGYKGDTITVTKCTFANDDVTLGGCAPNACKTPATADLPTGYDNINADTAITGCDSVTCSGVAVTDIPNTGSDVACASGYTGTPAVAKCSTTDDDAVFSGCNLQCKTPATLPAGYAGAALDTDVSGCVEGTCPANTALPEAVSGVAAACDTDYVGTLAITGCSATDDDIGFTGCNMKCSTPATMPAGYENIDLGKDLSANCNADTCTAVLADAAVSGQTIGCANGFTAGTVQMTGCTGTGTTPGEVIFSGCTQECVVPAMSTGYKAGANVVAPATALTNCNSETCTADPVDVTCDTGFTGTPDYAACSNDNTDAVLTGCAMKCTWPAGITGTGVTADAVIDEATCTSDACTTTLPNDAACAAGTSGTPVIAKCSMDSANAVLSGCVADTQCVVPDTLPEGYTWTATAGSNVDGCTTGTGNCASPTVTGLACDAAAGYAGTAAVTQCTASATAVVLTGCTVTQCKTPATADMAGYTGMTADTDVTDCTAKLCTHPQGTTNLACDTGYVGTAALATCTADDDDVVLSGCAAQVCKFPAAIDGYKGVTADANVDTAAGVTKCTAVSGECTVTTSSDLTCDTDNGFAGTNPTWTACTSASEYVTLAGCTKNCQVPAVETGYKSDGTLTAGAAFENAIACASGATGCDAPVMTNAGFACDDQNGASFSGTATFTGCTNADLTAGLTGCSQACVWDTIPTGYAATTAITVGNTISGCVSSATGCDNPDTTGLSCDAGYQVQGTGVTAATVTACTNADNKAGFKGCHQSCKTPATADMPTGYTATADTAITGCTVDDCTSPTLTSVSLACDTGYVANDAVGVAECTATNLVSAFTGCSFQCKTPAAAVDGYTFTVDTAITDCHDGDCDAADMSGVTCATGYTGTPAVDAVCTAAGGAAVTLTGCSKTCSIPDTVPAGYTGVTAGDAIANCGTADCSMTITGLACATDYVGTAANDCDAATEKVTFSGCGKQCVAPADVTGYTATANQNLPLCNTDTCQYGTTCATGYTGTVVVAKCTESNLVSAFSGCTAANDSGAMTLMSAVAVAIALAML